MTFKPSKYQKAIYTWIKNGEGNSIIQAVAGSGKTTTIIEATKLSPKDKKSIFLAFNRSIAMELKERLPDNIEARTLHSLGFSMFYDNSNTRPQVKNNKLNDIIFQTLNEQNIREHKQPIFFAILKKIIPLIKATMINHRKFEELEELKYRFGIEVVIDDFILDLIDNILDKCKNTVGIIDYDDMIWLPVVNDWKSKTYDWVFVDECQDLNKVQFELVKKICNGHTRIVAVGDRQQSIYAFRGANTTSMDDFKEYFKAEEFPLSISYRCPRKVVELAKEIVPGIESSTTAKEGIVADIDFSNTIEQTNDGDLILCRTNAPLIKVAFALIRAHKKAVVRGRDIGKNLIKIVNKYNVINLDDLNSKIINFRELQEEKIMLIEQRKRDKKQKNSLMTLIDSCDTILAISENVETVEELKEKIEEIFTDEREGIVCSTVHKAKGLEAQTIYIVNEDMMPHPMATTDEEIEQEMNIRYVALTRAKEALYFIRDKL